MEAPDKPETAEAVANWFAGLPPTRKVSAHECHDSNSSVRCVHDKDIAYAAPGTNHNGKHHELSGFSANDDWATPTVESTMRNAARSIAVDAQIYNYPLTFLYAADLAAGRFSGVTTHWEITKAHIGANNHTDPGIHFPVGRFMEMCKSFSTMAPPASVGAYDQRGFDVPLDPQARMGHVSARECGIDSDGWYVVTSDGGVRAEGPEGREAPFFGSYHSLDPQFRNVDRFFTGITPRSNPSGPGYIIHSGTDHAFYTFGPGLSQTGL